MFIKYNIYILYMHIDAIEIHLRGEPTESIDGNNHRNKAIKFWSNGITCLYRKCMVFPLKDSFTIENGLLFVKILLYFDVILPFNKKNMSSTHFHIENVLLE